MNIRPDTDMHGEMSGDGGRESVLADLRKMLAAAGLALQESESADVDSATKVDMDRDLEAEWQAIKNALSQVLHERDHYRRAVYAWAWQEFEKRRGELPEKDLTELVVEEEGQSLEAFIDDLKQAATGQ